MRAKWTWCSETGYHAAGLAWGLQARHACAPAMPHLLCCHSTSQHFSTAREKCELICSSIRSGGAPWPWRLCGSGCSARRTQRWRRPARRAVSMRVQGLLWLGSASCAREGCAAEGAERAFPRAPATSKAFPNLWPARHPTAAGRRRRPCLCRCAAAWSASLVEWPFAGGAAQA